MRPGRMHGVVDGEFDHRQQLTLTQKGVDVSSEYFFEDTVYSFCMTIRFGVAEVVEFNRVLKVWNDDCQNSAVNRGSQSDTSSRGNLRSRSTVSIYTHAHPCAVIDSRTAARCTI